MWKFRTWFLPTSQIGPESGPSNHRGVGPRNPISRFSTRNSWFWFVLTVEALKEIATQLGKDWNFSVDPCSNDTTWATPISDDRPLFNNTVTCNCSTGDGACHVTNLYVSSYSLFTLFSYAHQLLVELSNWVLVVSLDLGLRMLKVPVFVIVQVGLK